MSWEHFSFIDYSCQIVIYINKSYSWFMQHLSEMGFLFMKNFRGVSFVKDLRFKIGSSRMFSLLIIVKSSRNVLKFMLQNFYLVPFVPILCLLMLNILFNISQFFLLTLLLLVKLVLECNEMLIQRNSIFQQSLIPANLIFLLNFSFL